MKHILSDDDKKILARYDAMPTYDKLHDNSGGDAFLALVGGLLCVLIIITPLSISAISNMAADQYAKDLIVFKNTDYTCQRLYTDYHRLVYMSNDWLYKKPIFESKLLAKNCMPKEYISVFEDKKYCEYYSDNIDCRVSKLEAKSNEKVNKRPIGRQ